MSTQCLSHVMRKIISSTHEDSSAELGPTSRVVDETQATIVSSNEDASQNSICRTESNEIDQLPQKIQEMLRMMPPHFWPEKYKKFVPQLCLGKASHISGDHQLNKRARVSGQAAHRDADDVWMNENCLADSMMHGASEHSDANDVCVHISQLYDLLIINLDEWPEFFEDMRVDMELECSKFGEVSKLVIDQECLTGSVMVVYTQASHARRCAAVMDGRWFAGQNITARVCSLAGRNR